MSISDAHLDEMIDIGFDCIPPHRRQVLDALIDTDDAMTTTIATASSYPTSTARRTLEDLTAIGMVRRVAGREAGTNVDRWSLSEEAHQWYRQIGVSEISTREGKRVNKDITTLPDISGTSSTVEREA